MFQDLFTSGLQVGRMFHGMFVYSSGLRRERGPKNETSTPGPKDSKQVSKPKYEATALQAPPNIGYPNITKDSMHDSW
jgi:hypothetical protein